MRIRRLDLIRYGKFAGESLAFPPAAHDFHLVAGPNEAGKSTVRNAVLELLFGMPPRTPLAFLHEVSELRLGAVLEGEHGEAAFHRARGRTQLRTPEDGKLPDDFLAPFLGGASREFYEQMFGLDHERLVEGGRSILDASKDLGRVLFQSAAGIASLAPVREALATRAGELWTRRGSNSAYAQAEARFGEAATEFKAAHVRTRVWTEASDALRQVNDEIAQARTEHLRLETLRSRLERVRRLAPLVHELGARERELAALGDVRDLPPSARTELSQAQASLAVAEQVLHERDKDLAARAQEHAAIATDDAILAVAREVEALDAARAAGANHARELPLRRAEADRLLQEAFAAAAQLAWPGGEQALRESLPNPLALKTVDTLLREHGALQQARAGAQAAAQDGQRELESLQRELQGLQASQVPPALRHALADAQTLAGSEARQRALAAGAAHARRTLEEAVAALGRWAAPVESLRRLDLPSLARVNALQREEHERAAAVRNAREQVAQARAQGEERRLAEKHFADSRKVVTGAEVRAARSARDAAWSDIRSGATPLDAGAPGVEAAIRLADELVDAQLAGATDAATLQNLRQQAELAGAELQRRQQALDAEEAQRAQAHQAWHETAAAAGVPGIALDDLPEWLNRREAVFAADGALRQATRALEAEEAACAQAVEALSAALRSAAVMVPEPADLKSLVALASSFVQQADAMQARKQTLEQQVARGERSGQALATRAAAAEDAFQAWQRQWQQALAAARLSASAGSLAHAEAALELAHTVADKLRAVDDLRRDRIATMEAALAALAVDARRLAGIVQPDLLAPGDADDIARRLADRLQLAQTAAHTAHLAQEALREARTRQQQAALALADARAAIQPLLRLAGVDGIDAALPVAERSDRRRALVAAIGQATQALHRDGDGLARAAIEAEIAEQDPLTVVGLLDQVKRDLATLAERLNALVQRQVTQEQVFGAIDGRVQAAKAEAMRHEALAAMGEAAEEFVEMATASRLLKWAIDRYRDQKQGPMLQRAGEVFAQLTLGDFTRLVADHEVQPPALFARRQNGKLVEVAGLSEGTRDQLFLALRIAALELHLRHGTALPFIADDLFVNFDDDRARAGLQALRELSRHTQVLFLTHHEHLLPLVREVFGAGVNVSELQRSAQAA